MSEQTPYTPPEYQKSAFHCPRCGSYSHQDWTNVFSHTRGQILELEIVYCFHCANKLANEERGLANAYTVWYQRKMIYPESVSVASPNPDLEAAIQEDYREAGSILSKSPRGATALLRLCIQKLCVQLGEKGKDLNTDIGNLVKKGLPVQIQQALDIVRVIGNYAVHPGQIDLKDDQATAMTLFQLVNRIADDRITQPRLTQELFDNLPQSVKDQIQKRDQP